MKVVHDTHHVHHQSHSYEQNAMENHFENWYPHLGGKGGIER